ncbi:hypothetical protein SELMODRAFT_441644 [Selaginella moellendorffii]|uniref:Uncharacterized protein n=1 Tax=Selaginella moellendorffii TaxID=88036 RepID=D8RLL4_SELML|nr:hypothetical protein SELMODRAFT_441644 [Selaginella moellendorffii]
MVRTRSSAASQGAALQAFRETAVEGIKPSSFTLCGVVEACGEIGATAIIRVIHERVFSEGMLLGWIDSGVWEIGSVEDARKTLEGIEEKFWNAAIAACGQAGDSKKIQALEGVPPNRETFLQTFCSFRGRIEFLELGGTFPDSGSSVSKE